jgi:PAS domain S-box-containing protein
VSACSGGSDEYARPTEPGRLAAYAVKVRPSLAILLVEDCVADALLLERELRRGEYDLTIERVDSESGMHEALDRRAWDAVIADYSLPSFSAMAALALVKRRGLDLPFVIVSGAIDDEAAVSCLRAGAHDFVTKRKLSRLLPALVREMREVRVRRAHRVSDAALRDTNERYRIVAEHSSDAILITTEDGTIQYANPATEEIFGRPWSEVIGQPLTSLVRMTPHAMDHTTIATYLQGQHGDRHTRLALIGVHKTGSALHFEASIAIAAQNGLPMCICVLRDVTERRRAERRRKQLYRAAQEAAEEAQRANKAKSEFLAVMSHELRTPLTAIIGYVELMADGVFGPLTTDQATYLARVRTNGDRLHTLIGDVLTLSVIEAGKMTYCIADVPVKPLISVVADALAPSADRKRLTVALAPCAPLLVARADDSRLKQVLCNVLENAVKFTEPGGRIDVSCDTDVDAIRIRVQDTGCGMHPQQLDSIFDPFVQLDSGVTRVHGGVGLGLAISREFVRGMCGDLDVESTFGIGTVFTIRLPRATLDDASPTPKGLDTRSIGVPALAHGLPL